MSHNDDDVRLRDQLAIAAMQALITNAGLYKTYLDANEEHPDSKYKMERIAIVAYKVADEMRKARLKSFT